ncbi:MAG: hypothetical protein LBP59_14795 [Planctomycetaceae bacterium]|jgi:predicted peptidase|nr:hypothetical protein [Planctomycetaceae bacterium]
MKISKKTQSVLLSVCMLNLFCFSMNFFAETTANLHAQTILVNPASGLPKMMLENPEDELLSPVYVKPSDKLPKTIQVNPASGLPKTIQDNRDNNLIAAQKNNDDKTKQDPPLIVAESIFPITIKVSDPAAKPSTKSESSTESKQELTQEQIEAIAIQPNKSRKATAALFQYFKEESITYDLGTKYKGKTLKYRLHTPSKIEPGKKYPLILWLHGAGETGNDNKSSLAHLHHIITYLTGEKERDFFLLVPQAPKDHSNWNNNGSIVIHFSTEEGKRLANLSKEEKELALKSYTKSIIPQQNDATYYNFIEDDGVIIGIAFGELFEDSPLGYSLAMLDKAIQDYPVDVDRITVSGLSTGGDGTWRALERRPDLFAAAVPLVSWHALLDEEIKKSPILKQIPIWAIYSSDDNSIDFARSEFERIEKAGCNVKKSEFGVCGHNAWTPAMLQADIFTWLLSRGKKDGKYVAVMDVKVNPDDFQGIVEVATKDTRKPTLAPTPPPTVQKIATTQKKETKNIEQKISAQKSNAQKINENKQKNINVIGKSKLDLLMLVQDRARKDNYDDTYLIVTHIRDLYANLAMQRFRKILKEPTRERISELESFMALLPIRERIEFIDHVLAYKQAGKSVPEPPEELLPVMERQLSIAVSELIAKKLNLPEVNEVKVEVPSVIVTDTRGDNTIEVEGRIIEDCDRPWAMTSDSFYGMFPADWSEEAEETPEFIVQLTSNDLAKRLAKSISRDGDIKDFRAACKSILALKNKPMSSPWFIVEGGRLKTDIKYKLSPKGEMLARLLTTIKKSNDKSDKTKIIITLANKTLEKINFVLDK